MVQRKQSYYTLLVSTQHKDQYSKPIYLKNKVITVSRLVLRGSEVAQAVAVQDSAGNSMLIENLLLGFVF